MLQKQIIPIKGYGLLYGRDVEQRASEYNPTLFFGPLRTTLEEMFCRGYMLYCYITKAGRSRKNFTVPVYLTEDTNSRRKRYKVGTVSISNALCPTYDLGQIVKKDIGNLEEKGSMSYDDMQKRNDALLHQVKNLRVSDSKYADFVKDVAITMGASEELLKDLKKIHGIEMLSSLPDILKKIVDEKQALVLDSVQDDTTKDPWEEISSAFKTIMDTYPPKKAPEQMIGNYTVKEYIRAKIEEISLHS